MNEKTTADELKESLFYKPAVGDDALSGAEKLRADEFCEGYKDFLNTAKTEREAFDEIVRMAKENGFWKPRPVETD